MLVTVYFKKPITVQVSFAINSGTLQTLEGLVAYAHGDALVTGLAGERWPIDRKRFERTYSAADPDGAMGRDGRFTKVPALVQAHRADHDQSICVSSGRGILAAKAGDWIVTASDGESWVVADGIFQDSYAPVEPSAQ